MGWLAFGALPLASACSGGDGGSSSPCDALCRCVRDEGGDRSECRDRCEAFSNDPSATSNTCRSQISSNGYPACASYCDAFDEGSDGTGGAAGSPAGGGKASSTGGGAVAGASAGGRASGGTATGGAPSAGTTSGGASSTGGASGGKASGGAPSGGQAGGSACTDPDFPVYCPARNGAPADCWTPTTVCSTVTACDEAPPLACSSADAAPDCSTRKCIRKDPCALTEGSGLVCGQTLAQGEQDVLYWCLDGATYASDPCPSGCHAAPLGQPNYCIGDDPCVSAVIDGKSCGANLSPNAEADVLYTCQDQQVVSMERCAECEPHPPGEADVCIEAQGGAGSGSGGGSAGGGS